MPRPGGGIAHILPLRRLLRHEVAHANWFDDYGSGQPPDRNRADAVLRAAFDNPVAVGHIDQYVALPVEEANDLKCFE